MPHHVVVDGSNLATEGRSQPSLKQLNEAVLAYMAEHPDSLITVVVDATFGHRIDSKEQPEFDLAVNNNELVAPPAGAIGRGDAFVLSIANKVNATILSNDSFQEFHGQYDWLFDEGRLVGGKPVPHIGWVFVNRLPVRGPLSRKVTAEAKRKTGGRGKAAEGTVRVGSAEASKPMPVPTAPPPGPAGRRGAQKPVVKAAEKGIEKATSTAPERHKEAAATHSARSAVNDLLSFLTFVERHPAGTSVNAIVDHYSSHGAYVKVGDVVAYVPLRLMADPAPRSAREFMKVGEAITLVVDSFVPSKRSIDLAVPGLGTVPVVETKPVVKAPARRAAKAAASNVDPESTTSTAATTTTGAKKAAAKKAASKKAAPKKAAPKKVAKSASVKSASVKSANVKSANVKAASVGSEAPVAGAASAKKAAAKQAPTRQVAPKKTTASQATTRQAAPKKTMAEAPAPKKAAAAAALAKQAAVKKAAAKKAAAGKASKGDGVVPPTDAATPARRRGRALA